jgi:hypothetical protein
MTKTAILREHAEQQFAEELAELKKADDRPRPPNWVLSPWAVSTYLLGGTLDNGFVVSPKYIGSRRLIEIAVATLATDRAGLAVAGRAGDGQELGLRASVGRDLGRFHPHDPRHGRHQRGVHPLRLELRPAAG